MFSKVGFIFVLVSLVVSCSNDHKFPEKDLVVSLTYDSTCLSGLGNAIDLYREGRLSSFGIKKNFKCVIDALDYVKVRVRGENEGEYNSAELKNFLNKFLFDEDPKKQDFFDSLLKVKSDIIGGNSGLLKFSELEILEVFLTDFEILALKLQPYSKSFLFDEPMVLNAPSSLVVSPVSQFIKKWLFFKENSISLISILDFLNKAEVNIKAPKAWVAVVNLLRSSNTEKEKIDHLEKQAFVETIETYYTEALDFYKIYETNWELNRADFSAFHLQTESLLDTVVKTVENHPNQEWNKKDLTYLMELVSEYEVLKEPLSKEIQEHVVDVVFGKWFSVEGGESALKSENFQKITDSWTKIQNFILESESLEGYKGKGFPFTREGDEPFSQFTQRRWPSLVSKDKTILIADYESEVEFTFQSLFHSSWQFMAAELLIDSYKSESADLSTDSGINLDQVKEAYIDIFILLKEVGFLGEESRGSWFRIFNEGNLFVPTAKPDGFVSFSEAADYAAYMFSAFNAGTVIADYMIDRCPTFEEVCSFNYVQKDPRNVFKSLPGLWDYFSEDLKEKSYARWKKSFEYIAKLDDNDDPYEESHWFRGSVANQYNEVIYRKYDLDFSDTLDFEEVSMAYIDFKEALKLLPMVKGTAAENNDSQLKSVLTYFVKHGKAPRFRNGKPAGPLIRHVALCGGVSTSTNKECTFNSERSKIMSLLAYLTKISDEF